MAWLSRWKRSELSLFEGLYRPRIGSTVDSEQLCVARKTVTQQSGQRPGVIGAEEVGSNGELMKRWIVIELNDFALLKPVCEKIGAVVEEMEGEVVKASGFGDLCMCTRFPHRKIKTLEKAVAAAVTGFPVQRIIIDAHNPYRLREETADVTAELYRRQDEAIGRDS